MLVKEMMKTPVVIEKNITLGEAARIMSSKNIGSLIFIANKKIKGIITERDIIKDFEKQDRVSDIMTKKVITIAPDDTIDAALVKMRENKIKRLPVASPDGNLEGIITLTDILANFEELEEEFFF